MPLVDVLRSLVVVGVSTTLPLAAPSELMLDEVPGLTPTTEQVTDLDFDAYAALEPDSVAHIDPDAVEIAEFLAAIRTWTDGAGDEELVVELVRAADADAATSFVDHAAASSIGVGLGAIDPPFGGAWSYSGSSGDSWTDVVAWNQGPYAVTITHHAPADTGRALVDAAAVQQVEIILDATGIEVSEDATVADDAPVPPTDAPVEPEEAGFPTGRVVLWVIVAGAALLFVSTFRRTRPVR